MIQKSKFSMQLRLLLVCVAFVFSTQALGQYYYKVKPYRILAGLSYNLVYDDAMLFGKIPDVINYWVGPPTPLAFSLDYYFLKGLSSEAIISYNFYHFNPADPNPFGREGFFLSTALNAKYSFSYIMLQQFLDPFFTLGLYYARKIPAEYVNTYGVNAGFGLNMMLFGNFGLQLRGTASKAILPNFFKTNDNFLHFHAGFIFKFQDGEEENVFIKRKYKWLDKKVRFRGNKKL